MFKNAAVVRCLLSGHTDYRKYFTLFFSSILGCPTSRKLNWSVFTGRNIAVQTLFYGSAANFCWNCIYFWTILWKSNTKKSGHEKQINNFWRNYKWNIYPGQLDILPRKLIDNSLFYYLVIFLIIILLYIIISIISIVSTPIFYCNWYLHYNCTTDYILF